MYNNGFNLIRGIALFPESHYLAARLFVYSGLNEQWLVFFLITIREHSFPQIRVTEQSAAGRVNTK